MTRPLKYITLLVALGFATLGNAQTGIYIPSSKPIKNMQKAMQNPAQFCLLLTYSGNDSTFSSADLDIFDSVYNIAFNQESPRMYAMTIEGYGGSDEQLTQKRVDGVYRYFAYRCHAPFPIRYATNPISCSCHGDTVELLRYEVPVSRRYYNTADLPESRKTLNKTIRLENCVLVTFTDSPDECIGAARGCYVPAQDSTIRGYYASVHIKKGAIYAVENTKDTCPHLNFSIEEHLNYREVVERYFLVPHPKQLIVQAGYVVLHSNLNRAYGECSKQLSDSIYVRFPINQEQWDNKIRIYGKKYSEKGVTYKALTTKKVPSKISINIQSGLDAMQLDTIYLGKRIQPNELDDYFYEVKTDMEEGSFTVEGKHYKAYRLDRHGNYEIKKSLKALLRMTDDSDEDLDDERSNKGRYSDDEDIDE